MSTRRPYSICAAIGVHRFVDPLLDQVLDLVQVVAGAVVVEQAGGFRQPLEILGVPLGGAELRVPGLLVALLGVEPGGERVEAGPI